MAYNPRQRLAGGSGGIKGSAGANPSGVKALPNDNFIEGEFTRINDKAIGPAKSIPTKVAGNVLSRVAGGIGAATLFKDAVSGYGVTPSDQWSPEGFQAPAFGKQAAQSLPTNPRAENARYIAESKQRLASKLSLEESINKVLPSVKPTPTTEFTTKPSSEIVGPNPGAKIGDNILSQEKDGTLNISTATGGSGTIRFNDGRQLNPSQLNSLNKQIAFNNSEQGLNSFAKNAKLTNQRLAEAGEGSNGKDPLGQLGALLNQARQEYAQAGTVTQKAIAGHRMRNLEDLALKAKEIDATSSVANQRTILDARKYAGEAAFKGQQEADKQSLENYKLVAEGRKAGILDPSQAAAYLTRNGSLLDYNKLGVVFDQNQLKEFNDFETDDERANFLSENVTKDPRHIENIINSFNQYQKLGQ
jgi:hypothetical protein